MTALRRSTRVIPASLTAVVLLLAVPAPDVIARERAAPPKCTLLHAATTIGGATTLRRVTVPGAAVTPLPPANRTVEALGHSRRQRTSYGLTSTGTFPFETTRVVTVGAGGQVHELGPLRVRPLPPAAPRFEGIRAGAVSGDEWYLVSGHHLYTVDIAPHSSTYLTVTDVTPLAPWLVARPVDDIAVTADRTLRTVTTDYRDRTFLLDIAVDSGAIVSAEPVDLPPARYGAVVISGDETYAIADNVADRSRLYRIGTDPVETTELDRGRPLRHNDAAGCLRTRPRPPDPPPSTAPPPPSQPPESGSRSPSPTGTPPTTTTASDEPPAPTPAPSGGPQPPPSSPPAPSSAPPAPIPSREVPPVPEPPQPVQAMDTAAKRQWVLATLLLIIGAGVVLRRLR